MLLLSACSGGAGPASEDASTQHVRQAQREIEAALREEDITSGARVSCPEHVDWRAGESFDCDVSGVAGSIYLRVEVVSDDGRYDWSADGLAPAPA